jgi:3-hydroxyacyl-CoA dehydrogenase/3a,7a,12a-trihydroxy-5b-cholest-24-enoyl-CoA hydratase
MATTKQVFAVIADNVKADPSLVDKIKGIYQFNIGDEKWTVDLKNAPGSVKEGAVENPDCTLTLKSEDFLALATGKLNGQQAFMQGKLKVSQLVFKLLFLLHPPD